MKILHYSVGEKLDKESRIPIITFLQLHMWPEQFFLYLKDFLITSKETINNQLILSNS